MKSIISVGVLLVWIPFVSGSDKFKTRDYRSIPGWLDQAAKAAAKSYDLPEEPSYEILADEAWYDLRPDGSMTERTIYAMRVLNKDGIRSAFARISYYEETDKIRVFDSWLLDPAEKKGIRRQKADALDKSGTSGSSLASSHRFMEHSFSRSAKVGQIFAFEVSMESRTLLGSKWWYFQASEPVRYSRLNLRVPSGWEILDWNSSGVKPETGHADGWRYWERRDIAPFQRQDKAPSSSRFHESLALTVLPPEGTALADDFISIASWEEMSQLFYYKYRDRMTLSRDAREAALSAVEDAASRYDKAKVLAEMAQAVNYTNVSLNLGLGGGYIPRDSSEVHALGWGDCKDKATYLCALLDAAGVKAYPVIVNGSPRHWVDPEIPSPGQFNHCIAAIEADESFPEDATIEVEGLGRLLIFDATDSFTAFGDLSDRMHGTKAVVLAPNGGGLATLPRIEGDSNIESREIKAELMPNGAIVGMVASRSVGQSALQYRIASVRNDASSDLEKHIKDGLDDSLGSLKTAGFTFSDDRSSGEFAYSLQFGAASYANRLDSNQMLFSPVLLGRQSVVILDKPSEERLLPIMLDPLYTNDRYDIFLPVGYSPSDIPEALSIETKFGRYSLAIQWDNEQLSVQRRLFVSSKRLAPELADAVEAFFRSVSEADNATLTLSKESTQEQVSRSW